MHWVILFSLFLCLHANWLKLHGFDPLSAKYQASKFTCFDGSKTIPANFINDDYCDCPDGSDEPGTSACTNGQFFCINKGFVPKIISSHLVRDTICDCCDGSDEWISQNTGPCPNTCSKLAEGLKKQLIDEISEHEKGLNFLQTANANYETDLQQKKVKRDEIEKQIEQLELSKKEKEDLKSQAEERENNLKEKLKSEYMSEAESEAEVWINSQPPEEGEEEQNKSEEDKAKDRENKKSNKKDEILREKLKQNPELTLAEEESINAQKEVTSKHSEINRLRNDRDSLSTYIDIDFGENGRFSYLWDTETTIQLLNYKYSVKHFEDAKQGHTSVGKWNAFQNNWTEMKYANGQKCWGGPDRSLLIVLSCGGTTEILSVQEPNKCEYLMTMKTPGACQESRLNHLKAKLSELSE